MKHTITISARTFDVDTNKAKPDNHERIVYVGKFNEVCGGFNPKTNGSHIGGFGMDYHATVTVDIPEGYTEDHLGYLHHTGHTVNDGMSDYALICNRKTISFPHKEFTKEIALESIKQVVEHGLYLASPVDGKRIEIPLKVITPIEQIKLSV